MKRTEPRSTTLLPPAVALVALLTLIAMPVPAGAQNTADRAPLAYATVYAGGVDFLPAVAYRGAKITVSGRDLVYERTFKPGEGISLDLFDPAGQLLADGTYRWQLALTPAASEARELRRAAKRNGGKAPEAWQAETGTFTIRNGRMADPSLAEAAPRRRADGDTAAALPTELGGVRRAARIVNDDDDAVAAGRVAESRGPVDDRAATPAPAGRIILERTDAGAAQAAPAPPALATEEQTTIQRSYPTDGKNGRE